MSLHQDPTQTAVRRQKRSLWTDAWRRMRRSHTAVIGMILFALIVIVCFSAPLSATMTRRSSTVTLP